MATLGEKIRIARDSQEPSWSAPYLAQKLDSRLGKSESQWLSRIKNLESGRVKPDYGELTLIADVLGTDREWQTTEDDKPVKWSNKSATERTLSKVETSTAVLAEVPFWGYVPSFGWRRPNGGDLITVPIDYSGSLSVACVRVRGEGYMPRFRPGTLIVLEPSASSTPVPGVINVVASPEEELQLGTVERREGRYILRSPGDRGEETDVTDWTFLGHAIEAREEDEGGLRQ